MPSLPEQFNYCLYCFGRVSLNALSRQVIGAIDFINPRHLDIVLDFDSPLFRLDKLKP